MLTTPSPDPSTELSTDPDRSPIADAVIDHVELQVADLAATVARLTSSYGFEPLAPVARDGRGGEHLSVLLGQGRIRLLVVQALDADHPARAFVERHGDGVAGIALGVADPVAVHARLVARGAVTVEPPTVRDGRPRATVAAFGDVVHHLVQRGADAPDGGPAGSGAVGSGAVGTGAVGLRAVDHFAVCLPTGGLEPAVRFYAEVFGMRVIFEENIAVGPLGMNSTVVQNDAGEVTLTLIEPASRAEAGQIESFLADHGGAGVQHVAFSSEDIVATVATMRRLGTPFLRAPSAYYDLLGERLTPRRHGADRLRDGDILVDEDHHGQLFQIFTRSEHPRRTLFFEVIERIRARGFGSNNIRALYEAVELQRSATGVGR
ncbi:4-hydroxyphenylpyruvate dioxygenase [Kitasatospora sp. NPDC058170]|uniref:4-hydroxyphenylpyruvate dioxygenase n=1 Tax=Kitasatospora sp. NPDC058170 TaxID=3346364 RepID=UPI0036DE1584